MCWGYKRPGLHSVEVQSERQGWHQITWLKWLTTASMLNKPGGRIPEIWHRQNLLHRIHVYVCHSSWMILSSVWRPIRGSLPRYFNLFAYRFSFQVVSVVRATIYWGSTGVPGNVLLKAGIRVSSSTELPKSPIWSAILSEKHWTTLQWRHCWLLIGRVPEITSVC